MYFLLFLDNGWQGENIYPAEIEDRLAQHPAIVQAGVIGIPNQKYGETVGAFLEQRANAILPSLVELKEFVHQRLGKHKAPVHVFWLGVGEELPKNGSGKVQKISWGNELRKFLDGNVDANSDVRAKLWGGDRQQRW